MNGRGNKSKSCGLELGQMVQVVLVVGYDEKRQRESDKGDKERRLRKE